MPFSLAEPIWLSCPCV